MIQEFEGWIEEKKKQEIHNDIIQMNDIIRFLNHVKSLLFPGYVEYIADSNQYFDKLIEDIRKDLTDLLNTVGLIESKELDKPSVIASFFNALPETESVLKTDVKALYEGDPAAASTTEIILCYPGLTAIFIYRIAHILYQLEVPVLPRALSEYAHSKTGIDIHPGAKIASSFFIDHGTGIVIGQTCEIGKGVKIYQGVTLGALSLREGQRLKGSKRHPTIEDNVTIYSGASIFGGETVIGRNSTIGSNAFITSSVEENMIVTIQGQKKKHNRGK